MYIHVSLDWMCTDDTPKTSINVKIVHEGQGFGNKWEHTDTGLGEWPTVVMSLVKLIHTITHLSQYYTCVYLIKDTFLAQALYKTTGYTCTHALLHAHVHVCLDKHVHVHVHTIIQTCTCSSIRGLYWDVTWSDSLFPALFTNRPGTNHYGVRIYVLQCIVSSSR